MGEVWARCKPLWEELKARGWSVARVCREFGLPHWRYKRLRARYVPWRHEEAARAAQALRCRLSDLFVGEAVLPPGRRRRHAPRRGAGKEGDE